MAIEIMTDIADIFETPPDPIDFVWPGFAAGSVGALVAPGGTSKSFWALEAAVAVAGGRDLLDLRPQHTGRVLYLAAEDTRPFLAHRLHAIGKYLESFEREAVAERLAIAPVAGEMLDLLRADHLREVIKVATDARLIIIDTLSCVHTGDENSNSSMARLVAVLKHVSKETGSAVLFLHHISKGAALAGQGDQQQAARGASALIDNARWCGFLARMTKDDAKELAESPNAKFIRE